MTYDKSAVLPRYIAVAAEQNHFNDACHKFLVQADESRLLSNMCQTVATERWFPKHLERHLQPNRTIMGLLGNLELLHCSGGFRDFHAQKFARDVQAVDSLRLSKYEASWS